MTLYLILFSIFLAHFPNLKVDKVTSKSDFVGLIHKTNNVLLVPPNDPLNIFVNGEFLKGICLPSYPLEI